MTINITDYDFANKLIEAGAFWYCTKYPGDIEDYIYQPTDFIMSIINAKQKCILQREWMKSNQKLIKNVENMLEQKKIIGKSGAIDRLRDEIDKYSKSDFSIMIHGASGTGKELVAYNIHYKSSRKFENFVPINCGSLPNDLVESELFGYEKGAFTGADKKKQGLFEIADKGTIFLDEITELPLPVQVKLLRVIQEGEIDKIGRTDKVKVNVRIIAATNKSIEEEVKEGRFREDLYYRLNVIRIEVPELRSRKEDIPILINHFLTQYSRQMGRDVPKIDEDAMDTFLEYDWQGNVRELKNVAQRLLFIEGNITKNSARQALGNLYSDSKQVNSLESIFEENPLPLSQMEKMIREKYLIYIRDNSASDTEAAKKLGLAPSNYYRMAKSLGLK